MDRDYALFAEVVRTGSLSAAARTLHLSPAMVSKRLARLENRLGVRLIHRTTRRHALTPAGQTFYKDVLDILASIRDAEARISGSEALPSGRLSITAPTSFGRLHVAPHLKGFMDKYPQVDIQLDLSDGYVDLIAEQIDIAIRIAPSISPNLTAHRLASNSRILCAAPDYLSKNGAPDQLDDLRQHHLVAAYNQLPWRLEGPDGPIVVDGKSDIQTNSSEVVRELTLAGAGIALRSLWDVGRDVTDGRLKRVLPKFKGSTDVHIYAVYPKTPYPTQIVAAFISHLQTVIKSS